MKLKYNFVTRTVGASPVAVAVGSDSTSFNGMIKLNASGEIIFKLLAAGTEMPEIVSALCEAYDGLTSEVAEADAERFINTLRGAGLIEE